MNLLHTIRIKRLDLTSPQRVASAAADFGRLAWFDAESQSVINDGNPFIADTVCARPFEKRQVLGVGVHLHFILPQALTRFADNPQGVLEAPNRWRVNKLHDDEVIDSFIIESDFLSKRPQFPNRCQSTTILKVDPNAEGYNVYKNQAQPFRYMGRVLSLAEYSQQGTDPTAEYWTDFIETPFTAFAHGDLHFSSFYPNCSSVFGFYDPEGLPCHHYEVIGWYEVAENGRQSEYLSQIQNVLASGENLREELQQKMGLKLDESFLQHLQETTPAFERLLFYGKSLKADQLDENNPSTAVAIGNGAGEAFSALLAKEIGVNESDRKEWEQRLEALQFDYLKQQVLDLAPEFEAGRHLKGFLPDTGQFLFELELKKEKKEGETNAGPQEIEQDLVERIPLFKVLRSNIEELNKQLTVYEKRDQEIASKKTLLFSHWQKYLQATHPPVLTGEALPDTNRVLRFIRDTVLPDIEKDLQETGLLESGALQNERLVEDGVVLTLQSEQFTADDQDDPNWFYQALKRTVRPQTQEHSGSTIAGKIVSLIRKIKGQLEELNKDEWLLQKQVSVLLKHRQGQVYYNPVQPTLMLAGEWLKRFEQKDEQALLTLWSAEFELDKLLSNNNAKARICEGGEYDVSTSPNEFSQPLYLDWEAYFMPLEAIQFSKTEYPKNFIAERFEVKQEDAGFSMNATASAPALQNVSRYTGRTLPIFHTAESVRKKLQQLPDSEKKEALKEHLNKNGFLVQALDGLNAAFIQEKSQMQLPIGDPVAFARYKAIYQELKLAGFMDINRYHSPEPQFDFSPVRAGGFNLSRVALVNTFGQQDILTIGDGELTIPETMQPTSRTQLKRENLPNIQAFFYPRFMQSTAITAHWIKAENNDPIYTETSNSSPVCGWIVPNFFTKALAIYTAEGHHLGNILKVNNITRFEAGPYQEDDIFDPDKITNVPLKNFLKYVAGLSDMNDFLRLVHECLLFVDPESAPNHNDLNYFFGRPMALVRMQVDFITQGNYQCRKDHYAFNDMLKNNDATPQTAGYEAVEIPLRIGDYTKLNEGVVMYWNDADLNAEGEYEHVFSASYMPEEKEKNAELDEIKKTIAVKPQLTHSLAGDPHRLTLLIDPRADVHICSGVVPMKIMRLAERFWKATLGNLRINFEMGPGIFPRNEIRLNLPQSNNYGWSWLQKRRNENKEVVFSETPQMPAIYKAVFEEEIKNMKHLSAYTWEVLINKKVLVPGIGNNMEYALVKTDQLKTDDPQKTEEITALLTFLDAFSTGISPVQTDAVFTVNELHDGWIECYESSGVNPK